MTRGIHGPVNTGPVTPETQGREPEEHRCSRCYGPYGRSAIPCPNNPKNRRTT